MSILALSSNWWLLASTPRLYTGHEELWYGMSLWAPGVSCHSFVPPPACARVLKTENSLIWSEHHLHQLKHQCVTDFIFTLHSKHRFVPGIRGEINSFPGKTRTTSELSSEVQCLLLCIPSSCLRALWHCCCVWWADAPVEEFNGIKSGLL